MGKHQGAVGPQTRPHWQHLLNLPGHGKDTIGGVLMMALGIGAIVKGIGYQIGTLDDMGPGFFPTAVGALLALTGAAIVISGYVSAPPADLAANPALDPAPTPALHPGSAALDWRGWGCIIGSLVLFVLLGNRVGLLPASLAVVFVAALGDRQNSLKNAFCLALCVAVVCVVVFWWGLQVQLPLLCWRWG